MKKLTVALLGCICTFWLATGAAFAQSSGNFSAGVLNYSCTLNDSTGALSSNCGGVGQPGCISMLNAPIKVSNANGLALLVTPSLVTGLFTDTKIDTTVSSSSADIGVQVCVSVTNGDGTPATNAQVLGGNSNGCVVYDQRFQQISSGLFSQLSECAAITTTQACTVDTDCANLNGTPNTGDQYSCVNGFCQGVNTACNFDLVLSTLSAHSYNFVVNAPGGNYNVNAAWSLIGANTAGKASVAACEGPGTLTVTQTKVFNNSGSITVQ